MKLQQSKVIDARHGKGLTQKQVADGANVSLMTVNNAESGNHVRPSTGKAICDFLGLDLPDCIVSVDEEREGDDAA